MARLSKSRFVTGWQCPKLLWWKVHEPSAQELEATIVEEDRLAQGRDVGVRAREWFPGGVLIDRDLEEASRVRATAGALASDVPAIFEATFVAGDVYVACDVLAREGDGWVLVEVKSSSSQKDEHVIDAAVQLHVLRAAAVPVRRVEIMHLNKEFRHPDGGDLFVRIDVTEQIERVLPEVPPRLASLLAALGGPLPDVAVGLHCWEPRSCPFFDRCWPDDRDHVRRLYRAWKKHTVARMQQGMRTIHDIPATDIKPTTATGAIQARQLEATRTNRVIVSAGLADALRSLAADRVGYLDFETISRGVPVFDGLAPWAQVAAQFSYHERRPDGTFTHLAYLAEGPADPRVPIAEALLAAAARADKIQMYTTFERTQIVKLAEQLPDHRAALLALADKLVDLHPVVERHVYHPDFQGSFSMKAILTPLVPDLTYKSLVIVDGLTASAQIARLMFFEHLVDDRDRLREELLAYCKQDTWAMVRVERRLAELA